MTKILENKKIYQALTLPFNIEGYEIFTSASIGIALSSQGYEQPEAILRDADLTMYTAKEQGKARYEEFKKANEHFHLVNMETGDIVEFKNKELEKLKERIAKKLGFKLVNSKLELYGVPIKK